MEANKKDLEKKMEANKKDLEKKMDANTKGLEDLKGKMENQYQSSERIENGIYRLIENINE